MERETIQENSCLKRHTVLRNAFLAGLVLVSGCATHPITGRDQIVGLSAVQTAYANVGFALSTGAQGVTAWPLCIQECGGTDDQAKFRGRVEIIGAHLETSARAVSPDLFGRIENFRIELNDGLGIGTGSSAGGRIALGSGLAALEPTDTVLAFLIAREMGHVIARHAEENSGAAILFSALGLLIPGVNIIARFAASTLGSGMLKKSWETEQQREADEIAVALLERNGLSARSVALALEYGVKRSRLPDDEWGAQYQGSMQRVALIAASPPRYAEFDER